LFKNFESHNYDVGQEKIDTGNIILDKQTNRLLTFMHQRIRCLTDDLSMHFIFPMIHMIPKLNKVCVSLGKLFMLINFRIILVPF